MLEGKWGIFHLYEENFPSMFMPLWFTTVDGASKTSGGSARTRSCSISPVPCVIRWGSYATPLTVLMLAQDLAPENFSLKFVFTMVHLPPACSHEACVMNLATHSAFRLLSGGILGHRCFRTPFFMMHNPESKPKSVNLQHALVQLSRTLMRRSLCQTYPCHHNLHC